MLWLLALMIANPTDAAVVKCVADPEPAISLFRNSHATATAWLVKHYGLARAKETDKALVAAADLFIYRCGGCGEEEGPDSRRAWDVAAGVVNMIRLRGRLVTASEKCTAPPGAKRSADFADYQHAINAGRPVLVTFCYDVAAGRSTKVARERAKRALTVAGIGYFIKDSKQYIIARDGLKAPDALAKSDTVAPARLGLSKKGVWHQAGTSIYRWQGSCANMVLTFVVNASEGRGAK